MAAALCPFFHRSHSSAFCAAVNQIPDGSWHTSSLYKIRRCCADQLNPHPDTIAKVILYGCSKILWAAEVNSEQRCEGPRHLALNSLAASRTRLRIYEIGNCLRFLFRGKFLSVQLRFWQTIPLTADLSSCMLKALHDIARLDAGKACSILLH